jgi:hypothetical protein
MIEAEKRWSRLPDHVKRQRSHDALMRYREPHDLYLKIVGIADETTVPFLLHRLREDHSATEPGPSQSFDPLTSEPLLTERPFGFVCVHVHLVDALRSITNTDQGMYFPRWQEWWEANRHRTRREWALAGFAEAGFDVSDPIDERFGLELIGAMADPQRYRASNAHFLLNSVAPQVRRHWIELALKSNDPRRRQGAALLKRQQRAAR